MSVAGVVMSEDLGETRILVIKRRDNGLWEIPGGVLEVGERPTMGVRREVLEETGISCNPTELTGVYNNLSIGVVCLVFRCDHIAGLPDQQTDEADRIQWWTREQIRTSMREVFAIRVFDAYAPPVSGVPVRNHDGVILVD